MRKNFWVSFRGLFLTFLVCLFGGCGDPTLYELTGKVTLDGEPKERLIVYFNPMDGEVTQFNLGVGETDKDGNLTLRTSAGNGLAAGNYRVSFSYLVRETGEAAGLGDKDESETAITVEKVPSPYCDRKSSPVEVYIKRSQNEFIYDIPAN